MTKEQLQEILNNSGNKRSTVKELKKLGYHNTKYYKPTKGTDLQQIAKACKIECEEVETEKYWLFGSCGEYNGFEWIWIEQTKKNPQRYSVTIMAKGV